MTEVSKKKSVERHKVRSILIPNNLHELQQYYEKRRQLSSKAGNVEEKKLKRRVSDAKCRANISAGLDLLRKQVFQSLKGNQKVSKEMVLDQSYVRIKYLEGVLLALQHTKELKQGKEDHLKGRSLSQQLKNVHHQFAALQQRKGCVGWSCPPSNPSPKPPLKTIKDLPIKNDMDTGIKRLSKRRHVKRKSTKPTKRKQSSPVRKKGSPIIHLPSTITTPFRSQKRIKLAATDPAQDQVVPFSPILHPNITAATPLDASVTMSCNIVQSQSDPQSSWAEEKGAAAASQECLQEGCSLGRRKPCDKVPASPMEDVCMNPSKHEVPVRGSPMSTPMKMYQIVGASITPVKTDYEFESVEETTASSLDRQSPDLVCDEETTSWPEDESSTSSSSTPDTCLGCPWFSTPVRPTSLIYASHPPSVPVKQKPHPQQSRETPVEESSHDGTRRRKRLFRDGRELDDDGTFSPNFQPIATGLKKKYRKLTTAARIRPWDPTKARVLSPVQPYSGMGKSKDTHCDNSASETQTSDPDFCLSGYLRQKLMLPTSDTSIRPVRRSTQSRPKHRWSPEIIEDEDEFEFEYESEIEVVDPPELDAVDIYALDCAVPVSSACLDLDSTDSPSSPPCIRDVCLPPPTGTISPPTLPQMTPVSGCFISSPELFRSSRSMWARRGSSGSFAECGSENSHQGSEESLYPYQDVRRSDAEDQVMVEDSLGDLFEEDLGDVRHLDPALQPPSSTLESQDCILRLKEHHLEDQDGLTGLGSHGNKMESEHPHNNSTRSTAAGSDGDVTKALASFATSALHICRKEGSIRVAKKPGSIRLNLPKALNTQPDQDDDLNIWKFTHDALSEKDVFGILPSSCSFLSNN